MEREAQYRQFEPHPWLRNGHLQTIAAFYVRRKTTLPRAEERLFRVDAETRLKGACHWQPAKRRHVPVIVTVHGLEGSCDSKYAVGIAGKAYARGFHVVRMNQRNCGGTECLTPTLYNSGMSGDYRAVLMELVERDGFQQIFFVGYSMGGNLVTKMAAELGERAPEQLRGVAVVCPSLDLAACADALEKPENYFYQRHFVNGLLAAYCRKAKLFPERYSQNGFRQVRTVREFDDLITAPHFGFRNAQEYYEAAGANRIIGQVHLPMLLITAQDDPFVPYASFSRTRLRENPRIRFVAPEHGGHCAFVSKWPGAERFWAEQRIVEFCEERTRTN